MPEQYEMGKADGVTVAVVSVIDHGIGLAASAAKALNENSPGSEDEEIGYLMKALNRQFKVSSRPLGNIGLPLVQQLLTNLDGFMSIRTGRTEISRDFIKTRLELKDIAESGSRPMRFVEWVPPSLNEFSVGDRAGAAVTFMMPVEYSMERN
ncbi:MAG: hypothetical protein C0444_03200 [Microbacterium sp.]|nr:hypothetical protein [Microbacterium sp.]MBA4345621.1 hypothetical protein [Microbacterium sp.]